MILTHHVSHHALPPKPCSTAASIGITEAEAGRKANAPVYAATGFLRKSESGVLQGSNSPPGIYAFLSLDPNSNYAWLCRRRVARPGTIGQRDCRRGCGRFARFYLPRRK